MKKKALKKILTIILAFFVLQTVICGLYFSDYSKADDNVKLYLSDQDKANEAIQPQKDSTVTIKEISEGLFLDSEANDKALIFYPGAKVEYIAYLPLLYQLAENGIDVFMIDMPLNFAIFGMNKASDILKQYQYEHYYLAGHSLGGAMIANYCATSSYQFDGLVLLAAYPTKDLSEKDMWVLTIYGSEDKVVNLTKIEEGGKLMPLNYQEVVIEGANHAQFGNYGIQKGDGTAAITAEEQQKITTSKILEMINTENK